MKAVHVISILSKVILSFFLLLVENATAQAPAFEWAKRTGGTAIDYGRGIAVDGSGNSYITGSFEGSATFGNTTYTSSGNSDVYIVKYDASGNVLWARKAGGTGFDIGFGIAVDGSGNSYITGNFEGIATFGNTTLTSSGSSDVFIAKYDASGNALWAQKVGGAEVDYGRGIAVDGSGNSYITGSFEGIATFGNTTFLSSGSSDAFITKYDASGNALWAHVIGGAEMDSGFGIAVDGNGNSYVTGHFRDITAIGSTVLTSMGLSDVFIAKLDSSGGALWAQNAGGAEDDIAFGIAIDDSGNSYITGHYRGNATFGSTTLTGIGSSDLFIAKYDDSGNMLWARKDGGTTDDSGRAIAADGSGNCYITGFFMGSSTFGSTTLSSSGTTDVFILKYDASGNAIWAKKAGGAGLDFGLGIAVDGNGNSYTTGFFEGTASFGNTTLINSGGRDMFLAKLSTLTGLAESSATSLSTFPNPFTSSFQLSLSSSEPAQVLLSDMLGREVHHQIIPLSKENATATITPPGHLQPGMYLLQLKQGETTRQVRVMRQ